MTEGLALPVTASNPKVRLFLESIDFVCPGSPDDVPGASLVLRWEVSGLVVDSKVSVFVFSLITSTWQRLPFGLNLYVLKPSGPTFFSDREKVGDDSSGSSESSVESEELADSVPVTGLAERATPLFSFPYL